jgi:hypothetical protein
VVHESADYNGMAVDSMTFLSLVSRVARGPALYWKSKKKIRKKKKKKKASNCKKSEVLKVASIIF